ncbi:P-loop containing nucleoside triphosphate hydrolase protein, partial [Caulochytrium protostelioides]
MAAPVRPIVICGPSGSGKSTLLKRLFRDFPNRFGFSVSHTTRAPRPGEVDGREYHFVTRDALLAAVDRGEFVESATYANNTYGTSFAAVNDVLRRGVNVILDIDM